MHCQGCAGNIKEALVRLPAVVSVHASPEEKLVTVSIRDGELGREELCAAITAIGHVCGEE